jgi:transposase InsO family protein
VASRLVRLLASGLIFNATFPLDALAANPVSVVQPAPAQPFNAEQLDALLAPIALYPDELLTHLLMASTFPLEVVAAAKHSLAEFFDWYNSRRPHQSLGWRTPNEAYLGQSTTVTALAA